MRRAKPFLILAGIIAVLVSPIGPPVLRVLREIAMFWIYGIIEYVIAWVSFLALACVVIAAGLTALWVFALLFVVVPRLVKEWWLGIGRFDPARPRRPAADPIRNPWRHGP